MPHEMRLGSNLREINRLSRPVVVVDDLEIQMISISPDTKTNVISPM
jgi:hypothetical protein